MECLNTFFNSIKKNTIKNHRKQYVMIPLWLGSPIIKITVFLFCRQSWKTFQSLAWGNSTWSQKHGFFKNWMSDPQTLWHFCTMVGATAYITTAEALRGHWECRGLSWTWGWILPSTPIPGQHELSLISIHFVYVVIISGNVC